MSGYITHMSDMEIHSSEIAVIGAGPVGLTLALGLAQRGHVVRLVDAGPDPRKATEPLPARSTALMPLSIETLTAIGVWQRVEHLSAPLDKLRLIDDQADRWTNPVIETFSANEISDTPFGYNIINTDLTASLLDMADNTDGLTLHYESAVESWQPGCVTLADGVELDADLVFDCAGRHSPVPEQAGIKIKDHHPNQIALVCQIEHSTDHENISTEFQRREGPLTTVPLPVSDRNKPRSAIVWVHRPETAEKLRKLDDEAFRLTLQSALRGVLGEITDLRARGGFKVGTQVAERFDGPQLALVGETAHVLPPLGAQGLNSSFADVAVLLSLFDHPSKVADPDMLRRYGAQRRGDVISRLTATHFLNQAIQNDRLGLDHARRAALKSLGWLKPVRHGLMRAGMRPFGVS